MAKEGLRQGIFITFEGPEGCGKSTHSKLLCDYLRQKGYPSVHTREPGGTKLGEKVRHVLLNSKAIAISDLAELFLFEACRSEVVKEVIAPALGEKRIVICDRFSDATFAYQGYGGGIPPGVIRALDRAATGAVTPDLTILLDVDTVTGLRRAKKKGVDRMEKKTLSYHRRVRSGYLERARLNPARIKVIRVADGIEKTQKIVRREVLHVIQRYKRAG